MSSYRQILYHLIFRTKNGGKTLSLKYNSELFAYISGIIKNKNCHLYRINGMEEHIHMLSDLHPSICLAEYMRDIKTSTSLWLKQRHSFPMFEGWASGYAALTYSYKEKDTLIDYIKKQPLHHRKFSPLEELRELLKEAGIPIDDRYFP